MINVKKEDVRSGLISPTSFIKKLGGSWRTVLVIGVGILLILIAALSGAGDTEVEGDEVEARLEDMCSSLVGVGECRVMVTYAEPSSRYGSDDSRRVESVAVVCRGADKASVRAEITSMISALYGIGANRIFISRMK